MIISSEDDKRSVVVTPRGIFGVDVANRELSGTLGIELGILDSIIGNENLGIDVANRELSGTLGIELGILDSIIGNENLGIYEAIEKFGFFGAGEERSPEFGEVYVRSDLLEINGENDAINIISGKNYHWKKKKMKIKSKIEHEAISYDFADFLKDKKYIVDYINVLYKGDGNDEKNHEKTNIIVVPPIELTKHFGKVLRLYFDKNLDKSQINISGKLVDISNVKLPGLKTKKVKLGDMVERLRRPYVKLNMLGDEPIKVIRDNSKISEFSRILLKTVTKEIDKNADISDIQIENFLEIQAISTNRNILYRLPDGSAIKINKQAFLVEG